jgi:hypothetical protein
MTCLCWHLNCISWEGVLINFHWLFSFGRGYELEFPLLNRWLNLLSENLAITVVVRHCSVPLAILHPFELFCRWYGMELRNLNLSLLKQQIKNLISLSDIKVESFRFLFTKRTWHNLLALDPLCEPYHILFILWVRAIHTRHLLLEVPPRLIELCSFLTHPTN